MDAHLYNSGKLLISATSKGSMDLAVSKNLYQTENGALRLELAEKDHGKLIVTGAANLGGALELTLANGCSPKRGDRFFIVRAGGVEGGLNQKDDLVNVGGHQFKITYSAQSVTIEKVSSN